MNIIRPATANRLTTRLTLGVVSGGKRDLNSDILKDYCSTGKFVLRSVLLRVFNVRVSVYLYR